MLIGSVFDQDGWGSGSDGKRADIDLNCRVRCQSAQPHTSHAPAPPGIFLFFAGFQRPAREPTNVSKKVEEVFHLFVATGKKVVNVERLFLVSFRSASKYDVLPSYSLSLHHQ